MNRKIKFRGQRIDNGEWVYGSLGIDDYGNCIIIEFVDHHKRWHKVDPPTIGQYMDLHDRRGKEVYEGDVVFWIAIDMHGRGRGERGAIIWDKYTNAWAIMRNKPTLDGRPCIISRPFDKKHLEVIGNIHDNPELLNQ